MQMALVDDQPALDLVGLDADDLDPEGTGEAALEALLEQLRRGQRRSSAAPSS
jgi:hypothetical protein